MTDLSNLYLPSEKQIRHWCGQMRSLATLRDKNGRSGLDKLEDDLVMARRRATAENIDRDGYPTATMGSVGGHRSIVVVDEYGREDAVPVTAVEATAFDHIDNGVPIDRVQETAESALSMLQQAHGSLFAAQRHMRFLASYSNPEVDSPDGSPGSCAACDEVVTGIGNDRLKRGLGPCCYSTWLRHGRPELAEFRRDRKAEQQAERVDPKERAS